MVFISTVAATSFLPLLPARDYLSVTPAYHGVVLKLIGSFY
jgi:hypothetical protein